MGFIKGSSERGIAALAIIGVIILIGAVGGAGYYVTTKERDPETNTTRLNKEEQKQVEAECKKEIDDKDFCKFASNFNGGGEYKITMTTTAGSEVGVFTAEIDGANSSTVVSSGNEEVSKYILLDNNSYVYDKEKAIWYKNSSTAPNPNSLSDGINEVFDFEKEKPEAERIVYEANGKEKCGNQNCFKYKIVDPKQPELQQLVFFDDEDYKLRRFTTSNDGASTDATFEYVDINIVIPSPVEDAPQSVNGDMPTEAEIQEMMNAMQR